MGLGRAIGLIAILDAFGKMECLFSIAPDANSCGWHIRARVKKLEVKTS